MLKKIYNKVVVFHKDESGDIVQTAIILGILALLAFFVLNMLREPIKNVFNNIKTQITDAGKTTP